MPAYQDKKTGKWFCKFYYKDWQGQRQEKCRRGFDLKREALEWEREFKQNYSQDPTITFAELCRRYLEYNEPTIKENTKQSIRNVLNVHAIPYFGQMKINEITPLHIAKWQNELIDLGLAESTLKLYSVRLKAVFAFAVKYVGLQKNPCTRSIGSFKQRKSLDIWTPEQYHQFCIISGSSPYSVLYDVLFYCGLRVNEAMALQLQDVDFEHLQITVNKTLVTVRGGVINNPPKSPAGIRTIDIPEFLAAELQEQITKLYKPDPDARIFPFNTSTIRKAFQRYAVRAGLPPIRIHDLRHSHASYLIVQLHADPVTVSRRLGHESVQMTLDRYSHLYENTQAEIASKIKKA